MSLRARPIAYALLGLFLGAACARASDPLGTLRPAHPRLILLDRDLPALQALITRDPFAAANFAELLHDADGMLTRRVHPYLIDGPEKDLLNTARGVEQFVFTLSGAYRLTGQRRYADRAIAEMLAAAAYPDWNPRHTLDLAELTAALGLGYDWLYPVLTPPQRGAIRGAIVRLGLDPWLEMIEPSAAARARGVKPFKRTNNWVQVCVGGATLGALAVAEDEPARARTIIANSEGQMREIMKLFAPDGGFEEGPTYWSYATNYNILYLAALDSALGNDFGLSRMPGFAETGAYRIQALGPTLEPANFGDAHDDLFRAPQMFWMADRFNRPEYAVAERRIDEAFAGMAAHRNAGESQRFLVFALVYYRPPATAADPATVASFARTDQAFLRSDWSLPDGQPDTSAFFVAFKGGSAKASHGHLDLGSFVLDALGERWAIDLGGESYGVPRYFDFSGPRWTYFRTRNDSHNTLTVDSGLEDLDAYARISAVGQSAAGLPKFAVLDLDSVYKDKLERWRRGVEVIPGPRVLVQDEISSQGGADIVWRILTHAGVQLGQDPAQAVLSLGGKQLRLRILSPAGARFETRTLPSLPPPQLPLTGVAEVSIHLPGFSRPTTLAVLFSKEPDPSPAPALLPLAQWSK